MVQVKVYQNQSARAADKRVLERIVYDNPSVITDVPKANEVFRWLFGADVIVSYEFSPDK